MDIEQVKKIKETYDKYRNDLLGFCRDVLGYKDTNKEHEALCQFITDVGKSKLILMPRYTFKSSIATIGFSLWKLMKNPNLRILIYSDATSKAQGFLKSIKDHIEGSVAGSKFRELLYHWETDAKTGKWNESQILVNMRTTSFPEPTIDTAGIDTSLVGRHYDIVIFDDIVSDINVTTKEQMDKVAECYKRSLSLLVPGGQIIMVGTRWHFGDLYGRIIAENEERGTFQIFIRSAEKDGKYLFDNTGDKALTKEFLDRQRLEQGSYNYSCLYMNSPVDDETATFRTDKFSFYGDVKKDDLYITATCDPAGEGEDFTAITVVGTDNKMDMHILDIINQHLQPSEIIDNIISLHYKWNFKILGLETNFFRRMLTQELDRRIKAERISNPSFILFGVEEFEATARKGENKHSRIMGLQPYHERGALKFPGSKVELLKGAFSELAYQMIQFPHAPHDDILDSLAYHLPLIRKGGVVKKADLPINTPAWLERQWLEKEMERREHIPRRFRKRLGTLAFS